MKDFKFVGDKVFFSCEDPECPKPDQPHSVSRDEILASMFTVLEDLADDNDLRLKAVEVGVGLLWDQLYPDDKKGHVDITTPPPFEKSYQLLRYQLDSMAVAMDSYPPPKSRLN